MSERADPAPPALLLRRASVRHGVLVDVGVAGGVLVARDDLPSRREVVDLGGRPLLPGLADHHVHLFALAAARASVDLSPAALASVGGLAAALGAARQRSPEGWLRAIGYDVAASGPLDRDRLDAIGVGPLRVQDRTGILWILDSAGLDAVLPSDPRDHPTGVEAVDGRPTGVLRRLDHWLGHRVPSAPVELGGVAAELSARGIVAVMDAGATNAAPELAALDAADLPIRVAAMTASVDERAMGSVALGPVKVLLDDVDLPTLDDLTTLVSAAHAAGRSVAVHCVTDVQLAFALAAGIGPADRVEHASFVPDDLLRALAAAGPKVVVQPGLVWSRGDRYLDEVAPGDHAALHRLASLDAVGLRVAMSSDAPYGPVDPWRAVAAAADRRTSSGQVLGADEALAAMDAVALLSGRLDDPSAHRSVAPGEPADLVVLDAGWDDLATLPTVATTVVAGDVVHGAWPT